MMTALWTINLRIAGTSNVPLFSKETIFKNSFLEKLLPEAVQPYGTLIVIVILAAVTKLILDFYMKSVQPYGTLIVIVILAAVTKLILDFYMKSKSGFLLRAVGDNEKLVTALARDQGNVKILGLAIANGLVALSGCIFCQEERVFEISMGTGAVVIGLASVIIGTSLFRNMTFMKATTAVVIGSVLYKACTAVAMRNFEPQDMKLITAALFLIVLLISMERRKKVKIDA